MFHRLPTHLSTHPRRPAGSAPTALAACLCAAMAWLSPAAQAADLTTLPGVVVTSSGDYGFAGPTNGPRGNVLDNNLLTYWNAGGFGGWLQLDFGQTYVFDVIDVYGAANSAGAARYNSFNLSVSANGTNWATIASGAYGSDAGLSLTPKWGDHFAFSGPTAPQGRYLRWTRTGGADWGHIAELEVLGHLPAAPVPEMGSAALLAAGLGALGLVARRRRPG